MTPALKDALAEFIRLGLTTGRIVLEKGTSEEAAEEIIKAAIAQGVEHIPAGMTIQIAGQTVELPLDTLAQIAVPVVEAALLALIQAVSPKTSEIIVSDNVRVSWDITE